MHICGYNLGNGNSCFIPLDFGTEYPCVLIMKISTIYFHTSEIRGIYHRGISSIYADVVEYLSTYCHVTERVLSNPEIQDVIYFIPFWQLPHLDHEAPTCLRLQHVTPGIFQTDYSVLDRLQAAVTQMSSNNILYCFSTFHTSKLRGTSRL